MTKIKKKSNLIRNLVLAVLGVIAVVFIALWIITIMIIGTLQDILWEELIMLDLVITDHKRGAEKPLWTEKNSKI